MMTDISISLLREKFVLRGTANESGPVTAVGTRLVLQLKNDKGETQETYIIRTQNMHTCIRMAIQLLQSFRHNGPISAKETPYDWDGAWKAALGDFEPDYNPSCWACVYRKGNIVFSKGEHHPLLDLIEKCGKGDNGNYEHAISKAEEAFNAGHKGITIQYEGHIALSATVSPENGRCGIISRSAGREAVFNFTATPRHDDPVSAAQCLNTSAAFLEGLQLAFTIGTIQGQAQGASYVSSAGEHKNTQDAYKRLGVIGSDIAGFERINTVRYRPEKPEFKEFIVIAEKQALAALPESE